ALRTLRDDPQRLAEMGRRAREIANNYARVNELQRFVAIMEEAVQDPNGRQPSGIVSEFS
ncbi:MAG: hypothetical protein WAL51_14690, partial [Candidatus Acidiferrales bacterium]